MRATQKDVHNVLKATSRTFFIPIVRLPGGIQEAVASAYLCMRAIDEIEDHPTLENLEKARLLRGISLIFQAQTSVDDFAHRELVHKFETYQGVLPEVTLRIGDWACHGPDFIAPRIWEATAAMADRMAHWAATGWKILNEADLDRYTFGVAGAVGLLLIDVSAWFDGIQLNRSHAIHMGRGLQAVNILRNRVEDLDRGVDLYPDGWDHERMRQYAHLNLSNADAYMRTLPQSAFVKVIRIPLALAFATLEVLAGGGTKLSRTSVLRIVQQLE
jgi:farnesyl-diphosphate farnesyltransferase